MRLSDIREYNEMRTEEYDDLISVEEAQNAVLALSALSFGIKFMMNSELNDNGDTLKDFVSAIPEAKLIELADKENAKHAAKR